MERLLPAYPLFVKDPYFSIWAQTEKLNEENVIFWTGDEKKIYGYLKTEEGVFSASQKTVNPPNKSPCL